ncbi:MAG: hypothetical protein OEV48_14765 [Acidobacteriota bacterium]|jgi:hypothetical protein|nr:hypothetical protein [Acidobacteriota bacterium]
MFAIDGATDGELDYLMLAEAMRLEVAKVSEISDGGSVPELLFENSADLPVLIFDGEELVGAKQNRTVNLTILAPAGKTIKIPVSCVEAGRWRRESAHLEMSDRHHFACGRAVRNASVSRSMRRDGSRRSDQQRVWADISAKASRMEAPSATQAMAEIFDRHRTSLESFVEAFTHGEDQTGGLFAIGSEIIGLDLFDRRTTLAAMLPKLVRSYAIDALEAEKEDGKRAKKKDARTFLGELSEAEILNYDAVGLGNDLRLTTPRIVGGGLAVDGSVVHLAAFAVGRDAGTSESDAGNIARMSSRLRSYWRR